MSFELIIRNQAQCDIADILEEYEKREQGLGAYFLICLDASFEAFKLSHLPTLKPSYSP